MEHEESLEVYMTQINGVFRLAPSEVEKATDGHCGILLSHDSVIPDTLPKRELTDVPPLGRRQSMSRSKATTTEDGLQGTSPQKKETPQKQQSQDEGEDGDDFHQQPPQQHHEPGSDEEEEDEEDMYLDEEEVLRQLQDQYYELENEKKSLMSQNYDFQKRAVMLMTKEKALQGQANPTSTQATTRGGLQSGEPGTAGGGGQEDPNNATGGGGGAQPMEQNLEKEKQYQDVLLLIVEERKKLNKQLKEFDQLAVDLQTRLDDKEFKAKSIATSFKQFKK
jgi:hypothetical protein